MPDTVSVVNDEPNWSLLGNEVMQYFKKTAKFSIILGTEGTYKFSRLSTA